jgi:hypothetical protein
LKFPVVSGKIRERDFFMMRFLSLIIALSLLGAIKDASAVTEADVCQQLKVQVQNNQAKIKSLRELKNKNQLYYDQYQEDISKKIKISSNIFVVSTKIETAELKLKEIRQIMKEKKCLEKLWASLKEN